MIAPSNDSVLWARYSQNRSIENRNCLVERYLPIAQHLARKMARRLPVNSSWDRDTLLTEASLGLIQAVEGFDPARGLSFSTYSTRRVYGAMLDAIRLDDFVPRLERKRAKEAGAQCVEMVRMPAVANGGDCRQDWARFEETIPDRAYVTDDPSWLDHPRFFGLSERERAILDGYFRRGLLMWQIGEELGLSESRVSQIHSHALQAVRLRAKRDVPRSTVRPPADDEQPAGRRPEDTFPTSDHRELMGCADR